MTTDTPTSGPRFNCYHCGELIDGGTAHWHGGKMYHPQCLPEVNAHANTPTPRTDNTDHWRVDRDVADLTYVDAVSADFARELERENARLREVLLCADAMRNAAVDLMQTHCIPDSRMTDDEVVERMYEIFDGPLQRTYDAARAILPPVEGEDALCRCGHYKRNHGNPIFPCMADGCSCAGFRALATKEPQPAAKEDGK